MSRRSLWLALTTVFVIGWGISANYFGLIAGVKDYIASLAVAHDNGNLEGDPVFTGVVLVLLSIVAALLLLFYNASTSAASSEGKASTLSAQLAAEHEQAKAASKEIADLKARPEAARIRSEYDQTVLAAHDIVHKVLGAEPRFQFTRVDEVMAIDADGTASVDRNFEIRAGVEPVQFGVFDLTADDSADKIELPADIHLRARSIAEKSGETVRFLMTDNSSRKKEFALFFVPPIQPGDSRRFRISYRWPAFAGDLMRFGKSTFFANYKTRDLSDRARVTYELRFSKALGNLECTPKMQARIGGQLIADHTDAVWAWRYENNEMPTNEARLEFDIQVVVEPNGKPAHSTESNLNRSPDLTLPQPQS